MLSLRPTNQYECSALCCWFKQEKKEEKGFSLLNYLSSPLVASFRSVYTSAPAEDSMKWKGKCCRREKEKGVFNVAGKLSTSSWWPGFCVQTITTTIRVLIEHFHWFFLSSFLYFIHSPAQVIPGQSKPLYQYSLDRKRPMHTYSCEQNAQILLRLEKERLKKYGSSGRLPVSKYWTTNIRAFLALPKKLFGVENCFHAQLVLSQLSIETKTNMVVIQVRERENEITKCKSLQKSTFQELNFEYSKLLQLAWVCNTHVHFNERLNGKQTSTEFELHSLLNEYESTSIYFESRCTRWSRGGG